MTMGAKDLAEIRQADACLINKSHGNDLYEEMTLALYAGTLFEGDNAIDCGVNMGIHSSAMSQAVGASGSVLGFEAAPGMVAQALKNLKDNQNVKILENAVWNRSGEHLSFNVYPFAHGLSSLRLTNSEFVHETITVTTATLDESTNKVISLIKLDVEGAEYHALRGASRIMEQDRPVIVFENGLQLTAEKFDYTRDDFFDLFESHGYHVYTIAGMPVVKEHWEGQSRPYQFMALHPASPRTPRAFAITQAYLNRLCPNLYAVAG